MRREDWLDGWYYKLDGQTFGPVAAGELKELLAAGRLQPQDPVWKQVGPCRLYVRSVTAVGCSDAVPGRVAPPRP